MLRGVFNEKRVASSRSRRLALPLKVCQGSVELQWAGRRMIRWFEHHQVYAPSSKMVASGADLRRPFEDIYFTTSDGVRLNGWFFPADKTAPRSHLVFLLLHGNANNISHRLAFYEAWLELGVNVFSIDYRGYG